MRNVLLNKTIGSKIWSLILIFSFFFIIIVLYGLYSIDNVGSYTLNLYKHPYSVSNSVRDIKIGITSIHRDMKDVAIATSKEEIEILKKKVDKEENNILKQIAVTKKVFLGDKKKIGDLESKLIGWRKIRNKVFSYSLNGEKNKAFMVTTGAGKDHIKNITKDIDWLLDFANMKGKNFIEETTRAQKNIFLYFYVIAFIALITLILISHYIVKKIKASLLEATIDISDQVFKIQDNTKNLSGLGEVLLNTSNEQSSFLSSTVEAVTELHASAKTTNDKTKLASEITDENKSVAIKGKEFLNNLSNGIADIQDANKIVVKTVLENNKDVSNIVHMIKEIAEKTQVINDIVFQTKLLSFNASVEAARAGEHGKGFSVVAEEIGNLASLSGKAATEINEMLSFRTTEITELVHNSNEKIEGLVVKAKDRIQKSIELSQVCQESFEHVTLNAGKVNSLVTEVKSMTGEQLSAIDLIHRDVDEINLLGQKYQESSKETQKMSSKLVDGQESLNVIIFKLKQLIISKVI